VFRTSRPRPRESNRASPANDNRLTSQNEHFKTLETAGGRARIDELLLRARVRYGGLFASRENVSAIHSDREPQPQAQLENAVAVRKARTIPFAEADKGNDQMSNVGKMHENSNLRRVFVCIGAHLQDNSSSIAHLDSRAIAKSHGACRVEPLQSIAGESCMSNESAIPSRSRSHCS